MSDLFNRHVGILGLKVAATLTSGMLFGGAMSVGLVTHPAFADLTPADAAVSAFDASVTRENKFCYQVSLAAVGSGCAMVAFAIDGRHDCTRHLVGGVILGSIMPYTWAFIKPINTALLDKEGLKNKDNDYKLGLLQKWNKMHSIRCLIGGVAFGIFVSEWIQLYKY